MLLEEITSEQFPYVKNQKLLVTPLDGETAIRFYDINDDEVINAETENGYGLHCMVLQIDRQKGIVKVRFFGDVTRSFIVDGNPTELVNIKGVENLAQYSSKTFFDKFGRVRQDIENGIVGWLSFDNNFFPLESERYVNSMVGDTSMRSLGWEEPSLGRGLDVITGASRGADLGHLMAQRMNGRSEGNLMLNRLRDISRRGVSGRSSRKDRGRLQPDNGKRVSTRRKKKGAPRSDSKIHRAISIYRSSSKLPREEVVAILQKSLGVTYANANTYYSKAKGIVERGGTQKAWEIGGY